MIRLYNDEMGYHIGTDLHNGRYKRWFSFSTKKAAIYCFNPYKPGYYVDRTHGEEVKMTIQDYIRISSNMLTFNAVYNKRTDQVVLMK